MERAAYWTVLVLLSVLTASLVGGQLVDLFNAAAAA